MSRSKAHLPSSAPANRDETSTQTSNLPSTKPGAKPGVTSTIAGGAGGTTLVILANLFAEPYRTIILAASPFVASIVATGGPDLVKWIQDEGASFEARRQIKRSIRVLKQYIKTQGRDLEAMAKDDPRREKSIERILAAQKGIDDLRYGQIAPLIPHNAPTKQGPTAIGSPIGES